MYFYIYDKVASYHGEIGTFFSRNNCKQMIKYICLPFLYWQLIAQMCCYKYVFFVNYDSVKVPTYYKLLLTTVIP